MNQYVQSRKSAAYRRWGLPIGLILSCLLALAAPSAGAAEPQTVVRSLADQTISLLSNKSFDRSQRLARLRKLMHQNFNFTRISRSVLARNWKAASGAQQKRFLQLFPELLLHTYLTSLESYSDEKVDIESIDKKGTDKVLVSTKIVSSSKSIPVVYRLRNETTGWKIYDVAVEGVSMVSNYRSSYAGLIKNNGMDDLLAKLEAKLGELRN